MKKKIELRVLRVLKSVKDELRLEVSRSESIEIFSENGAKLKIVDLDIDSDFFFELKDYRLEKDEPIFLISYKPSSDINLEVYAQNCPGNKVVPHFLKWSKIVDEYNNIMLSPDEKILRAYEEEFYTEYQIIDEDAGNSPFSLKQQLYFDKFLETIEESLIKYEEDETVLPIIQETKSLRENLTSETRNSAMKKLSKIISKIRKNSLKLLKEVFNEFKKQAIKKIIEGTFDGLDNILPM